MGWQGTGTVGLAVSVFCGATACRQIVDFDDGSPPRTLTSDAPNGPPIACGMPYATADCASCVEKQCCNESAACDEVKACQLESACLQRCGSDADCRAQCGFDAPVSTSDAASALASCLASRCESECGLACGTSLHDYGNIAPKIASECHDCIVGSACEVAAACARSADCDAYRRCFATCSAPDCKQACAATHPEGAAIDPGLGGARLETPGVSVPDANGACNVACGLARNWSCVGRTAGLRRKSDTVDLTLDLKGVTLLDVSVCDRNDVECLIPLAPATRANDQGRVEFALQQPESTTLGQGIDGYVQVTSPKEEVYSFFTYWGFPITEPRYRFWVASFSRVLYDNQAASRPELRLDPEMGTVIVSVHDCDELSPPDVEVTLDPDPGVAPAYGYGGGTDKTDGDGFAFFARVPVGFVTATVIPRDLGSPSAQMRLYVRKGWTTAVWLSPNL